MIKAPSHYLSSITLKVTGKEKNGNFIAEKEFACLKGKDCLFNEDDKTVGEKYKVTMVVVDKEGSPISKKVTQEVKITLDEECKTKYSLHHMSLSGLDFYSPYSEENSIELPLLIKRKGSKVNTISIPVTYHNRVGGFCVLSGSMRVQNWSNSNSETTININTVYNEKTQTLTANWPDMDSLKVISFTIKSTICGYNYKYQEVNFNRIERVQGDEIHFKLRKRKETSYEDGNEENTSNDSMKLNNDIKSSSSIQGSFQVIKLEGVQITNKGEVVKDVDVEAIVSVKDCKGNTSYIVIDLKYNEKTGSYANSKALALCNKTGMEVTCFSINAYSAGTSKKEKLKDWGPFCGTTDHF